MDFSERLLPRGPLPWHLPLLPTAYAGVRSARQDPRDRSSRTFVDGRAETDFERQIAPSQKVRADASASASDLTTGRKWAFSPTALSDGEHQQGRDRRDLSRGRRCGQMEPYKRMAAATSGRCLHACVSSHQPYDQQELQRLHRRHAQCRRWPTAVNAWMQKAGIEGFALSRDIKTLIREDGRSDRHLRSTSATAPRPVRWVNCWRGFTRGAGSAIPRAAFWSMPCWRRRPASGACARFFR